MLRTGDEPACVARMASDDEGTAALHGVPDFIRATVGTFREGP